MTAPMTLDWLEKVFNNFPAEIKNDKSRREFTLFGSVIIRVFGQEWCERYIMNPNGEDASGFLKLDFANDIARESKALRMAHLAEMLFNLHQVEGFEACVAQMRNGEIKSGFAELEFGKLLYINEVAFRFVDPRNRAKGEAYDYEVIFPDGLVACADAKCKVEAHEACGVVCRKHTNQSAQAASERPAGHHLRESSAALVHRPRNLFDARRRDAEILSQHAAHYFGEVFRESIRLPRRRNSSHAPLSRNVEPA